jgi:hypothetical protein
MSSLADRLPPRTAREHLLRLISDAAVNDGRFRQRLTEHPHEALREFFGRRPPSDKYDFRVLVEDQTTFHLVVPQFGHLREVAAPPTITPRSHFEARLHAILREMPEGMKQLEAHPKSFIANSLNFRLPGQLVVKPVHEARDPSGRDVIYIVLKHPPHDALFLAPYSLVFAKSTSRVIVQHAASLEARQAITVEAWVQASTFDREMAVASHLGRAGGWALSIHQQAPRFTVTVGGAQHHTAASARLAAGRWHYLAGVYNGVQLQVWLDGVNVASRSLQGELGEYDGPLTVGNSAGHEDGLDGELDELRVWTSGLTPPEIARNRPRKAQLSSAPETLSSLKLYFPCDEGNGRVVHDRSGNENEGTLHEVEWTSEDLPRP